MATEHAQEEIKLCLDWTPNTNHLGIIHAISSGIFTQHNIRLTLVDPAHDNYQTTPCQKLVHQEAHIALAPTESLFSYATSDRNPDLIALAAVLQKDASALVVTDQGFSRPRDLQGKRYASYSAKYEDWIVRGIIQKDGGVPDIVIVEPPKLDIWDKQKDHQFDFSWQFLNWEVLRHQLDGHTLTSFNPTDCGVPYSYSPLMLAKLDWVNANKNLVARFIEACRHGWMSAHKDRATAVKQLHSYVPSGPAKFDELAFLSKSADMVLDKYAFDDNGEWGTLDSRRFEAFAKFLMEETDLPAAEKNKLKLLNFEQLVHTL